MKSAIRSCYAAVLGDCEGGLSAEHYLTAAILEVLNADRKMVTRGYPFLRGETKSLPPAALTAKVLCRKHNSQLSVLDDTALRVFTWARTIETGGWLRDRVEVDGALLERWMLKLHAGLLASGQAITADKTALPTDVPRVLVDALFRGATLPDGAGLYFALTLGEQHERTGTGVTFKPWSNLALEPAAIDIDINGLRFVCSVDAGFKVSARHFHPSEIRIRAASWAKPKRLVLAWPAGVRGAAITVDASWRRLDERRSA